MKNRHKSRSGCRTCKLRRLRCDETKPECRNCKHKGLDCPGYQQRLQWSTKHEKAASSYKPIGPIDFEQLASEASKSIVQKGGSSSNVKKNEKTTTTTKTKTTKTAKTTKTTTSDQPHGPIPDADASAVGPVSVPADSPPPASSSTQQPILSPIIPDLSSPTMVTVFTDCASQDAALADIIAHTSELAANGIIPAFDSSDIVEPQADDIELEPEPKPQTESGLELEHQPELTLHQPIVDIPTFLIEHWFKSVCSSWSAFDSHANPYRVLTSALWSTSMPVFYSLQAISAASLVVRLPHVMREVAVTAPRLAAEAIMKELMAFSAGLCPSSTLPRELLVSLFCMSSSLCWMEARQLGLPLVRQARAVLKCLNRRALAAEDRRLLDFFNGCLIYEEMLRSVVSDDEVDFANMLSWPEPPPEQTVVPAVPHAWTGVASDVLRLFGKSMALCRRSRMRWRRCGGTTYRGLQDAMADIAAARLLEESLLAVEFAGPDDDNNNNNNHDHETDYDNDNDNDSDDEAGGASGAFIRSKPVADDLAVNARHLRSATEAYRLSSLLQLYQTFPDLMVTRIPTQVGSDGSVAWSAWVVPLALHIAALLETIPPGSMSCIQPLLCICAGSGLRFDDETAPLMGREAAQSEGRQSRSNSYSSSSSSYPPLSLPDFDFGLFALDGGTGGISEATLRISRARHFLMDRLRWLELSLPPKPIGVAKDLLRAVWTTYDDEMGTDRVTHWIDVMTNTGLQSLFG